MAVGYNPRIVKDGLVFAVDAGNIKSYPGSGTAWTDLVSSGIGTHTDSNPNYSSANGGSIEFNGSNDKVDFASSSDFAAGTDPFSFSVWIRRNGAQIGGGGIICVSGTSNWEFRVVEALDMRIRFGGGILNYSSVALPDLTWTNMSFVREGTGVNESKLYVDGVLKAVSNDGFDANITGTNFKIGVNRSGNDYFGGNISIVKYYNRALTASEVKQNFNALRGRYGI